MTIPGKFSIATASFCLSMSLSITSVTLVIKVSILPSDVGVSLTCTHLPVGPLIINCCDCPEDLALL